MIVLEATYRKNRQMITLMEVLTFYVRIEEVVLEILCCFDF
ncbi:MAG: hypothetical protein ABDH28_06365 [Brevinematia bacterium]